MERNILASFYRWLYRMLFSVSLPLLGAKVGTGETVSRFLQSGQYTPSSGRVKPRAFHPAREDRRTSVFRVLGLSEGKIWKLLDIYVAQPRSKELRARADVSVAEVVALGLRVESAEPPPRHSNITDWPVDKHEWMSRAQELADAAILRVRSPSPVG